jgi:hypothetical protein
MSTPPSSGLVDVWFVRKKFLDRYLPLQLLLERGEQGGIQTIPPILQQPCDHRPIARSQFGVNSVPLSDTIIFGLVRSGVCARCFVHRLHEQNYGYVAGGQHRGLIH